MKATSIKSKDMELTKRAQKWIELNNRESEEIELSDKYGAGYYYNPRKSERYSKLADKTRAMIDRLTDKLTTVEKAQIEAHYTCPMFDY